MQYLLLEIKGDIVIPESIELIIERRLMLEETKKKFSSNFEKVVALVKFEETGYYDSYMRSVMEGVGR